MTVDLTTCVPGQKLLLRDGAIITYIKYEPNDMYPHKTIDENGAAYTNSGNYYNDEIQSDCDVVQILPLETTEFDKHPSVAWWESCPWITDRLPTEKDGDIYGRVYVKPNLAKIVATHWGAVHESEPWIHTGNWQPPVITPVEILNNLENGQWPTLEQWNIIRKVLKE